MARVGVDVNAADTEGLLAIAEFLAKNGVTAWMPTLVPDSDENYARSITAIDRLIDIQQGRPIAQALGVHYEGVFASEKMCGAPSPQYFKKYTGSEADALPRLRVGIHMATLRARDRWRDRSRARSHASWMGMLDRAYTGD